MKTNAIVLDIDGTLLNQDKCISPQTKQALIQAQTQGIKVILASGRPTPGMIHLAKELEMDKHHGFLVSYNGACVYDCQSHCVIYEQVIEPSVCHQLLKHLEKFDVIPMIAIEDRMYVNDVFAGHIEIKPGALFNIIEYESRGGRFLLSECQDLSSLSHRNIHKVLVAGEPAYLQSIHHSLSQPFTTTLSYAFSAPFYFEFTDKGVDKASTLATLDIDPATMICFGDGHNDISMLKYAGIGVAMANAEPAVKQASDAITLSNNDDGIYHFLKQHAVI